MCCIFISKKSNRPSLETLKKIEKVNGDGGSLGWYGERGLCHFKKDLTAETMYELILKLPNNTVCGHFRKASPGLEVGNKLLNHPFICSKTSPLLLEGRARRILFHNGSIDFKRCNELMAAANIEYPKNQPFSDSRMLALILAKHNNYNLFKVLDENSVYQKFVILDSKERNFRMFGFFHKEGEEGKEIYFSKLDWRYTYTQSTYINDYWPNEYPDYVPPVVLPVNTPGLPPNNIVHINSSQVNDKDKNINNNNQSLIPMSRRDKKREARREEQKRFWAKFLGVNLNQVNLKEDEENNVDIVDVEEVDLKEIDINKTKDIYQREHEKPPAPFFDNNTKKILGINRDIPPYAGHGAFSDI